MTGGGRHVTTRQNWPASRLCRLFWPGQCRSARLSVPRSGAGRSASVRALADILPPAPAARQALARSLGFDATIYGNSSNISARIHGTKGGRFLIAPTDWQGEVPLVATLFRVATPISWILLRVLLHSPKGLPPTTALQDRLRIKPVEPGTVPTQWPDGRDESAVGFMRILDFVLRTCGHPLREDALVYSFQSIGIAGTRSFNEKMADPAIRAGIEQGHAEAQTVIAASVGQNGRSLTTCAASGSPLAADFDLRNEPRHGERRLFGDSRRPVKMFVQPRSTSGWNATAGRSIAEARASVRIACCALRWPRTRSSSRYRRRRSIRSAGAMCRGNGSTARTATAFASRLMHCRWWMPSGRSRPRTTQVSWSPMRSRTIRWETARHDSHREFTGMQNAPPASR